ncbi:transcriptional regulator [Thermococcus chitonophagus]|uniref:Transcriptional regulator n=1 Tax=Thermococcus chitonophagus TaxID=54262 RepID=A0A160VQW4_9EURY|nr:TrmB family transcriptional regulator sugar-binding domain-containing protein [Thermococcus chitonophagus]ASJ15880.1 transcriptional regulator [Thermococcus chitonophagus]CUX77120.1 Transcriptional regulator, TrmB family [Thermococcus chitonophagus]
MIEDEIIQKLQKFGLTKYESLAYITLLKLGPSKATDVTRESGIPHTRIYDVLSSLSKKGFVDVMHGTPRLYAPVNPEIVLERLKKELIEDIENLKKAFEDLYKETHGEELPEIWTIHGFENTIERAEYIIRSAKHEILINTPFEFLRQLRDAIEKRDDALMIIVSNFSEIPRWLKEKDNAILAKSGEAPWLMGTWVIGDIDYALFFGTLPENKGKERFYSFWAKSAKLIQNYVHWFYTMYFDNSTKIKELNYEKLSKPIVLTHIRTVITVLKNIGVNRKIEVIGRLLKDKQQVKISGKVLEYEYTPLTANITIETDNGEKLKVGGLGSYLEDIEGEVFLLY